MIGRILKLIIVTISKYAHYLDLANKFHCAYFDDDSIYNFKTRALEIIVELSLLLLNLLYIHHIALKLKHSNHSFKTEAYAW